MTLQSFNIRGWKWLSAYKLFQSKWKVVLQESSKSKVNCQFFAYKSFKTAFKRCFNGI